MQVCVVLLVFFAAFACHSEAVKLNGGPFFRPSRRDTMLSMASGLFGAGAALMLAFFIAAFRSEPVHAAAPTSAVKLVQLGESLNDVAEDAEPTAACYVEAVRQRQVQRSYALMTAAYRHETPLREHSQRIDAIRQTFGRITAMPLQEHWLRLLDGHPYVVFLFDVRSELRTGTVEMWLVPEDGGWRVWWFHADYSHPKAGVAAPSRT